MGKIGQARGFLFFRIVNKFFFRKRKKNNYIESCDYKPTCVSPLSCVPKKNSKFRLITDLRQLNSHCCVPKFRNDDIRQAVNL